MHTKVEMKTRLNTSIHIQHNKTKIGEGIGTLYDRK